MPDDDWGLLEPLGDEARGVTGDSAVLAAMVEVERALLGVWSVESGSPEWLSSLGEALTTESIDRPRLRAGTRAGAVPVIDLVAQLREQAETAHAGSGQWVHRGATSQDILDTALVLVAHRAFAVVRDGLVAAGDSLAELAAAHESTSSVAHTLGQSAGPTTFGVAAAGWLDGISSAIAAVDATSLPVQLGGSVGTGEALDVLAGRSGASAEIRAGVATTLGLTDPGRSWHAERTPMLAIAATAAAVSAALGRIGRDLVERSRPGRPEVSFGSTGSSSAIPGKQNPVDAVLLTANALRSPGLAATVLSAAVSYDERPAGEWHAEWQAVRGLLRIAVESSLAAATVLDGLSVDTEALAAARMTAGGGLFAERERALSNSVSDSSADSADDADPTLEASRLIVAAARARFTSIAAASAQPESSEEEDHA